MNCVPRLTLLAVLACATLAGFASPSFGEDLYSTCTSHPLPDDIQLPACNKAIDAGEPSVKRLAALHFARGILFYMADQSQKAVDDYTKAILLDPTVGSYPGGTNAFESRANAWAEVGEYAQAVADYTESIRLYPVRGYGYGHRGMNKFFLRQYEPALQDFRENLKLDTSYHFIEDALWQYLAAVRVDGAVQARRELEDEWPRTNHGNGFWPGPVAVFLMGKLSLADLRLAATRGDFDRQARQGCELDYYLGQWHAINGRAAEARRLFEGVVKNCRSVNFTLAHTAAVAALKP